MANNLYDTLGVDKNATDEEIKAAFKNKAKEAHPDKPGGSTEQMQALVHVRSATRARNNYYSYRQYRIGSRYRKFLEQKK